MKQTVREAEYEKKVSRERVKALLTTVLFIVLLCLIFFSARLEYKTPFTIALYAIVFALGFVSLLELIEEYLHTPRKYSHIKLTALRRT